MSTALFTFSEISILCNIHSIRAAAALCWQVVYFFRSYESWGGAEGIVACPSLNDGRERKISWIDDGWKEWKDGVLKKVMVMNV